MDVKPRDKGVLLATPTDYVEPTDAVGVVDITGPTSKPMTFGLTQAIGVLKDETTLAALLVRETLTNRGSLSYINADLESFYSVRKVLPLQSGFYYAEPPKVSDFLSDMLGPTASYYGLDRDARVYAGCMLPPINPGPYGYSSLLEWTGIPNGGVTFADNAAHHLTQAASDFGLLAWFKLSRRFVPDLSLTATGDYAQPGYTIIDKMGWTTQGYYLGLDANTGALRFAAGGIDFGGGLHYATFGDYSRWQPGVWYAISVSIQSGLCWLEVQTFGDDGVSRIVASGLIPGVTGTLAASPGIPLRIGHGPQGTFVGSICYAIGCSPAQDPPSFSPLLSPLSSPGTSINTGGTNRFFVAATDGYGDAVLDSIQGLYGRTLGTRWCPRAVLDYRVLASSFSGIRRPLPAWIVETNFHRNYAVISGGDVSTTVSASERSALATEKLSTPATSLKVKDAYLNSREVYLNSPVDDQVSAEVVNELIKYRLSVDRRLGVASGLGPEIFTMELGDEIVVYDVHPDFQNGKALRVSTTTIKLGSEGNGGAGGGAGLGDVWGWG